MGIPVTLKITCTWHSSGSFSRLVEGRYEQMDKHVIEELRFGSDSALDGLSKPRAGHSEDLGFTSLVTQEFSQHECGLGGEQGESE